MRRKAASKAKAEPPPQRRRRTSASGRADRISQLPDALVLSILSFLPLCEAAATALLSQRWRHLPRSLPDRLSQLPDPLLHSILSLLPLRHAAATLPLSTRWPRVFHSLPSLVFDSSSFSNKSSAFYSNSISDPVRWIDDLFDVLDSRRAPVQSCSISADCFQDFEESFSDVIRTLCKGGVEELVLDTGVERYYTIPAHFYSCRTPTKLKLYRCRLSVPPKFTGLRRLRSLHLHEVKITDDQFERLVTCCRALQSLTMYDCRRINNLVINAYGLSELKVSTHTPLGILIKKAPRLASVAVCFDYHMSKGRHYDSDGVWSDYCKNAMSRSIYYREDADGCEDLGDDLYKSEDEKETEVKRLVRLLKSLGSTECLVLDFPEAYTVGLMRE